MYNFLEFKRLNESNSLIANGDITQYSDWLINDVAPIGTNDDDWGYSSLTYQTDAFGGAWTNGLSQEVSIKAGTSYIFRYTLQSGNANEVTFYILGINGTNSTTIGTHVLNNETSYLTLDYSPTSDFDKIMIVANNSGGGGVFIGRVLDFNVFAIDSVFSGDCGYALPLVKGDVVKGYTNFEIDDTDIAFADLKLGLYSDGFYLYDIATLIQVVVSGDIYNVHFEWTVPTLPKGNYRFVLYEDTEIIHYASNVFRYTRNISDTSVIKYRNTKDTLGYLYESELTYYNQFRIDLWRGRPVWPDNSRGYETYEGAYIRTKSDIQKQREFKLSYASESVLEAFTSAFLHDEVYIDDIEFEKGDGESLAIDWSQEEIKIGTGTINLLEVSYSKSIESC